MKPKAALVKAGLKPKGFENARGRMSAADIASVKDLAEKHPEWNIEGFGNTPSAPANKPTNSVSKPARESNGVVDVGPPIRHEDSHDAFVTINGKTSKWNLGMKGCCNNCKNSLTYCFCTYPVVNVDHETVGVITFKPKAGGK